MPNNAALSLKPPASKSGLISPADCSQFRQTLLAQPPKIVHGTTLLLVALVGAAALWSALTPVAEVVRAPGRLRPRGGTSLVTCPGGELFGTAEGVRITKVFARPGVAVQRGDLLVRLDTARIDNEMEKQNRVLRTARREVAQLERLQGLARKQYEATREKIQAELSEAADDRRQAESRRASALRQAEEEYRKAKANFARYESLRRDGVAPVEDYEQKRVELRVAEESLTKNQIPVGVGRARSLERTLQLEEENFAARAAELALQRDTKMGEIEAAQLEIARLKRDLNQAELCSPRDGVVIRGDLKPGDVIKRGQMALVVAADRRLHFEAAVPTTDAGQLRPGMEVRIKLHAFDYQRYGTLMGKVVFVAPDSKTAARKDRPAVYVVKVAIAHPDLARGELRGRARLGMEGVAEIVTGRRSLLGVLVSRFRRSISLG